MRPRPIDYVGLVVCDTRRAAAWKRAFERAGIDARVTETLGEESEDGASKVSVLKQDLPRANAMVTAVTRGELSLPGSSRLGATALISIVVIAALLAALAR